MQVLIDAYNLAHKAKLWNRQLSFSENKRAILKQFGAWLENEPHPITLIFDAQGEHEPLHYSYFSSLRIIDCPKAMSADDYILKLVREHPHPQELLIISSDKELSGKARQLGAAICSSEAYLRKVRKKEQGTDEHEPRYKLGKSKPLNEHYLKIFENRDQKP